MKTSIGSLTLALALIVTPAAAEGPRIVPPPEYDRPYAGKLSVVQARDQDHLRELCRSKFPPIGAFGCAFPRGGNCWVILAPDADIKAAGIPPDVIRRHEIAHCNGWPDDHKGALPYEEWASDDTVASRFDEFALNAVGRTVMEVAGNLGQKAAQFIMAAKSIGLKTESKLTGQVLSNPVKAVPLAKAAGIGTNLSDDEWREAHAQAFRKAKARQDYNASWRADVTP